MQAARRNLLKTGLMCTGAAAAAGVSLPASAAVEPKSKIAREEWDVVVVGAGFAGLCAALEAKERGAKVLLIEKMGRPDCTSAYSSGWIAATKTRYQDKDDDSKELYFKEMMEVSGGRSDPALIRAYAEIAGESVDWLGDHGMTYKIWKQHAPERMRCHIVPAVNGLTGGAHMVKVMLEALEKAGVPVRYNTKAVELVTDECFNVLGVSCIEKHRRVELMTKGGVILATGGFAGNNAMVGQYIGPWASRMVVRGAPWATGENIRMAEQVMAKMVNMDQFYAGPISPVGHCNPSPLMHAGYGIQINTDGRRFVQEHLGQIEKAVGIASLTKNNMSYLLIGQDADANNNILSNTLTRFEKLGLKVASGKTIEEAVKQAGLPVEAVMETVAEYNKAVREGKAAELVPPYLNEHPHELKTGPFYLVPAVGGIANTFLAAAGYSVGTSLYEPELVDDAKKVMAKAKELGKTLPLPVDVVTAKELAPGQTATVCDVDKVPADEMILDVGPKTVELYAGLLQKAATVVWNGPVGAFETDPFGAGTKALAEALAASPAFVVVGGGDSVAAVESYGLADKMGYISTGGGASLELLEGKLLPSVAALQDRGE